MNRIDAQRVVTEAIAEGTWRSPDSPTLRKFLGLDADGAELELFEDLAAMDSVGEQLSNHGLVDDPQFCMVRTRADRATPADPRLIFTEALFIGGSTVPGEDILIAVDLSSDATSASLYVLDWEQRVPNRWEAAGALADLLKFLAGPGMVRTPVATHERIAGPEITEDQLRTRLRRIFVDGWAFWKESPDYAEKMQARVESLRAAVASVLEVNASIAIVPANVNHYYTVEAPLTKGFSGSISEADYDQVKSDGPGEYFQLLISRVAPVCAGVWHRFSVIEDEFKHEMFDWLDAAWLEEHPQLRDRALELRETASRRGASPVDWTLTLKPADEDWPIARLMPENPDLRHYLFEGYYDDWGGIVKPVRG